MKIYLVQHADAVAEEQDAQRPLSDKGNRDAAAMAAFLRGANISVDEIVHSGKLRAEQTATVLSNAVWQGKAPSALQGIGPNDGIDYLCNTIMAAGGDLMVVGHMPFMGRIAAKCLRGEQVGAMIAFEPGAVLCLKRLDEGSPAPWALEWFVKPSMLSGA